MDESTIPRVVLQELGFVQVTGERKDEGMGHKLSVLLLAHSTLIDNPGAGLSLRLCFPQLPELGVKTSCHLVVISHNKSLKPMLMGT